MEASKRRLIHQLDTLALPIEERSAGSPHGLAFDLVYLPGEAALTGHLDGIITLDLCETDEQHRDALRRRLDEPFRTLIGHLRHEIGHHYWDYLVPPGGPLDAFRQLFGDERADYRAALTDHYLRGGDWNRARHITPYAGAHPLEDWAETFAHYLHIADATTTAIAHHLTVGPPVTTIDADGAPVDGNVRRSARPLATDR